MSETPDALVFEFELEAPPHKVWRALETPQIREAWLGEPEAGPAKVARADPGERLDLVWPTDDGDTLVSFRIEPGDGEGTHLTVIHRALVSAQVIPLRPAAAPAGGWRMAA